MNAIEFDKPVPIQFHGGRWDGMEIEMKLAPDVVHIDPNGNGVAKTDPNAPPLPPGWTTYFRCETDSDEISKLFCYELSPQSPEDSGKVDFA